MHLKSLVLKGFKSFADRSVLVMEPGITAIVGPNGSGKSNISDAVLWVLGELNAKHLRGHAMEDVIFSGSSARKSVGVAEVDLILDNSDGTLPVDYNEVAITRRMYRSGESEYLINGTMARRMDVLDILHDSGLGVGAHSIISQGSLDSVLQSRPEDRRALIEEAAGVLKHKRRKEKSERKLAVIDAHLVRIKDITAEVERQLRPLERKAKQAQTYHGLTEELSTLNLTLAVDDLRTLRRGWDEVCSREQSLEAELAGVRTRVDEAEAQVEALQEQIRRENIDMEELTTRHRRMSSVAERFDAAVLLLHEKRRAIQSFEAGLRETLESNKIKREQLAHEISQSSAQLYEVCESRRLAEENVAKLLEKQACNTQTRRDFERTVQQTEQKKRAVERDRNELHRKLNEKREALSNGLAHMKAIEERAKEFELRLTDARVAAELACKTAVATEKNLAELVVREADARKRVASALEVCTDARAKRDEVHETLTLLTSEIKGVEQLERTTASSDPARSWLLDRAKAIETQLKPLTHVICAPQNLETLVERLLEKDVSALLIEDEKGVQEVATLFDACDKQGEAVLVPCAASCQKQSTARAAAEAGLGRALIDELTYPCEAAYAVEALLGDVVVCKTKEEAFAAHERDTHGARFVSEDGCVIWPNGKATLGISSVHTGDGLLRCARRLEELRTRLQDAQTMRIVIDEEADRSEEGLRISQAESLKLSQDLAELRGKTEAACTERRRAEEYLASCIRERACIEDSRVEAKRVVSSARSYTEEAEGRLKQLETDFGAFATHLEEIQNSLVPLRKEAAQLRDELSEARLKAATLAERETYLSRMEDTRSRDLEAIDKKDVGIRQSLAGKTVAQKRIGPLCALLDNLTASVRGRVGTLEQAATTSQNSSRNLHASVNEARTVARTMHDTFDAINERLSSVRVAKGRLEVQVEGAVNVIVHDCNIPLDRALHTPELENRGLAEEAAFKLKRRITNMGAINPDAAEEYKRLKVRFDYLAAQLSDLEGARRCLTKIIHTIDERMKDDFLRTYEAVDKNFQEIFGVLFPGGAAHLSLVDPDDIDTTGVEVAAQPKGKHIAKMSLMSGGEKSLTALALLFAVYRIRSAPFYILDEVEAALDDSNLRRLITYLDNLRDSTQLIMITHQRRTMEMADVLFGVSMQGDGVTKVISQKLDRALQYAQ